MKRTRHSAEQIVNKLREADAMSAACSGSTAGRSTSSRCTGCGSTRASECPESSIKSVAWATPRMASCEYVPRTSITSGAWTSSMIATIRTGR